METKKHKKRIMLTVDAEKYDEAQRLVKETGLPQDYISQQFNVFLKALVPIFERAKKDAEERKNMTFEECSKVYFEIMKKEVIEEKE